jgi:uncharacterized repeat protein (TIGR01451 family)/gliding motility-associated-like protein
MNILKNNTMNTLNKLIILVFTVFMFIPKGYSQSIADPGIEVLMSSPTVTNGSLGILNVNVGNYGNGDIVQNSLTVVVSVGVNAEIIGVSTGSDVRWTPFSLSTGSANTMKLTNSGGSFSSFDVSDILLNVRGTSVGDANGIIGNVVYITANNPLLCVGCITPPLNISQGNSDSTNDNSSTSLSVIELPISEDDINQTMVNTAVDGNVLINDRDPMGGVLVVSTTPVSGPFNGSLVLNSNGTYTYTSNTGFIGVDTFIYEICNNGNPVECTTGEVFITVTGPSLNGNYPPIVQNDNATTEIGSDVLIRILDNDSDPDGTINIGSVSLDITSIPGSTCANTVNGRCLEVNVPNEGTYILDPVNGVVSFDPEPGFVGETTPLAYTLCDNNTPTAVCANATISVVISDPFVNEMTAEDDATIANAGDTLTANVLSNDIDPDGSTGLLGVNSALAIIAIDGSIGPLVLGAPTAIYGSDLITPGTFVIAGMLLLNTDGTYEYTADINFFGSVFISYVACDNDFDNACDSATLYLTTLSQTPQIMLTSADCSNAATVVVTNYNAGLTYTSSPLGLTVGSGGMVSGGIAGNNYSIIAENATTSTATSLDFIFNNDAQLPAPGDVVVASIDQGICSSEFLSIEFQGPLGVNEILELYTDASLTVPANPAVASGTSWLSLDPFTTSGSLWAVRSNSSLVCPANALEIPFIVLDCLDLAITKTVSNEFPNFGDRVDFVITLTNLGTIDATNVNILEDLPSGFNASSAIFVPSVGSYDPVSSVWSIPSFGSAAIETLTVSVVVESTGDYTNCASITSLNEVDSDLNNNESCASITPSSQADLRLTKIVNNATPNVGDTVQFTISLINDSNNSVLLTSVIDLLPSGYTFLGSSVGLDYDPDTGIWTVNSLPAGQTRYLLIDARVNANGTYENCASIQSASVVDPNLANNDDCATTVPVSLIDLSLIKTVDNMSPEPNAEITFTISVTNSGPSDATGVEIMDALASGYEFISAYTEVGSYDANTGIWSLGNISNDVTYELQIRVNVLSMGEYLNTTEVVYVNEQDFDSTPNNGIMSEDDYSQVLPAPVLILSIPNVITVNGDEVNDEFKINNLEVLYPNFGMQIFNRWGNPVYEYTHGGNPRIEPRWWDGFSDGKMNISKGEMLPPSTYFYVLRFNDGNRKPETGWVYLNR